MITSAANPRIKAIKKLRERKERQANQLFYAEGLRLVIEAIQIGADIESIIFSPELLTSPLGYDVLTEASQKNLEIIDVSVEVFKSIALKEDPQGIAVVARQKWRELSSLKIEHNGIWIALVEVSDPGNLGTILRTLDSTGGKGVILLDQSTDPYDPTAIRASMGAIFSLSLVKSSLEDFQKWKVANDVPVIGAAGDSLDDYHSFSYPDRMVLMMGSERQGFQPRHRRVCDRIVRIPMKGRSDSLNLAVATAVILFEIFNHRRDREEHA